MLSIEDALAAVQEKAAPLGAVVSPLAEALGLVLAEEVSADLDLPPFDKALVDGYAVRSQDLSTGSRRLSVGEEIPAGRVPTRPIGPGEAAVVMTGAPLPSGADAVVMVEKTRREAGFVWVDDPDVAPGRNRLLRGREMTRGEVVLRAGVVLNPARLGLLASVGKANVSVVPRPTVVVLPTGDELVEPDRTPGPGQIRNSNATILRGLAAEAGTSAVARPVAPDEPVALREAIEAGMEADVLLITGGVSAGNRDLVPATLESLGVARVFHKIRLKPGKPLWFGVGPARRGGRPGVLVFGLPGNPVSGIVGFALLVRPALDALAGRPGPRDRTVAARLSRPFRHNGDRPTYFPSRLVPGEPGGLPTVETLDWAGSADLRTVASADGFTHFPAGDRSYEPGEIVRFLPLG